MSSLQTQKAVDRSNIGACHLRDGDFPAAIASFSAAFNLLKTRLGEDPTSCSPNSRNRLSSDAIDRFVFLCEEDDWQFGKQDSIIYRNGITMPPKFVASESDSRSRSTSHGVNLLLTSIVVFNLAVAHHRYATETCAQHPAKMNHGIALAVRLYENSYKLQRATGQKKCPSFLALTMAVLNNLGNVYESANNHTKAKNYFTQLTSTLIVLMDRQDDMQTKYKSLITRFLTAMSHLIFNEKDATAAAA
jgi:tetratricopeptide (TPR) repeat protein